MQGTARPWTWTGWQARREVERGRRHRVRLQLQNIDLRRLPQLPLDWRLRPELAAALYPNQIRHLIRWEGPMSPSQTMQPPFGFPRDPSMPWMYDIASRIPVEPRAPPPSPRSAGPGGGGGGGASWWEGAGRGLPLGAAILAALMLLIRLADKCSALSFFNKFSTRRRQSEEWPTPNVMATSLAVRMTSDLPTTAGRPESPTESISHSEDIDLPPPYSACATTSDTTAGTKSEDPPPPYSACYVTYTNPKDRPPSVQIHPGRSSDATSSREEDTVRLYLEDGRVVQRSALEAEPANGTYIGEVKRSDVSEV